MKRISQGKLIANDVVCQISFEERPLAYLHVKTHENNDGDNIRTLTGSEKWYPFKFNIMSTLGGDLMTEYEHILIIPDNDSVMWKLTN